MMFLESTTNLLYMNSTPTGKMDSLTLCVLGVSVQCKLAQQLVF